MLRVIVTGGLVLAVVAVAWSQEVTTRIQDRVQLAAIQALVEKHAPGVKVFQIDEVPVLPAFHEYLASVRCNKRELSQRRYTYTLIELVRPSEHSSAFDAGHPFAYSFRRQVDAPEYEVYRSPKAKQDVLVVPAIADETVERVLAFIESSKTFTYKRGSATKTLAADDILAKDLSIVTGDRPDLLHVYPAGQFVVLELRVRAGEVELVKVTSFVI